MLVLGGVYGAGAVTLAATGAVVAGRVALDRVVGVGTGLGSGATSTFLGAVGNVRAVGMAILGRTGVANPADRAS